MDGQYGNECVLTFRRRWRQHAAQPAQLPDARRAESCTLLQERFRDEWQQQKKITRVGSVGRFGGEKAEKQLRTFLRRDVSCDCIRLIPLSPNALA